MNLPKPKPEYVAPLDARQERQVCEVTAEIIAHGIFRVETAGNVITAEGDGFKITQPDGTTHHINPE